MTKPKVIVTDAEKRAFLREWDGEEANLERCLTAFLEARLPELFALTGAEFTYERKIGHNAAIAAIARGRG